jgi:paraquat-inducible protein B
MQLSANGLSLQIQSLLSILIGGIAFETPASGPVLPAANTNSVFPPLCQPRSGLRTAGSKPANL